MLYPQLPLESLTPEAQEFVRNSRNPDLALKLISRQVAIAESLQAWQSQLGKPIVWNAQPRSAPLLRLGDKIEVDGSLGVVVTVYHRQGLDYTGYSYYVDLEDRTVEVFESSLQNKLCVLP